MRGAIIGLTVCLAACAAHKTGPEPFSTAPPSLHAGQVALGNNEASIAASIAESRLAVEPDNPDDLLLRARAEAAMGEDVAAGADFRRVLAARPYSADASLGLAKQVMASDPAAAESLLAAVVVHGTPNAAVWNNLGVSRDLQGRHADAQDAYRRAIAADPLLQAAQANLARSLALSRAP